MAEKETFPWLHLHGHLKKSFKFTFEWAPSQLSWTINLIQSSLGKSKTNKHGLTIFFLKNNAKLHILKIGAWKLNGRVFWYDVSNKGIFNKIACFLGGVSLFSKIRQILSDFFWVGNNKLKEFYIFLWTILAITVRIRFLILVNICPSKFLLTIFYPELFDKIPLWRKLVWTYSFYFKK